MKNPILFFAFLLGISLSVQAQEIDFDSSSDYIVWEVEGTVKNAANGKAITSGMSVPESASLTLAKDSSVKLSGNGKMVDLNQKGTFSLAENSIAAAGENNSLSGFLASLSQSSGWGKGDSSGLGGGWGAEFLPYQVMPRPRGGKVPKGPTNFLWRSTNADVYLIRLFEDETKAPVFSALCKKNQITIDLSQLALKEGADYAWEVTVASKPGQSSGIGWVNIAAQSEANKIMRKLKDDPNFKSAPGWMKYMRKAHAMEEAGFVSKANDYYMIALDKHKDNEVVKNMYGTFLKKHDLGTYGWELLEQ